MVSSYGDNMVRKQVCSFGCIRCLWDKCQISLFAILFCLYACVWATKNIIPQNAGPMSCPAKQQFFKKVGGHKCQYSCSKPRTRGNMHAIICRMNWLASLNVSSLVRIAFSTYLLSVPDHELQTDMGCQHAPAQKSAFCLPCRIFWFVNAESKSIRQPSPICLASSMHSHHTFVPRTLLGPMLAMSQAHRCKDAFVSQCHRSHHHDYYILYTYYYRGD